MDHLCSARALPARLHSSGVDSSPGSGALRIQLESPLMNLLSSRFAKGCVIRKAGRKQKSWQQTSEIQDMRSGIWDLSCAAVFECRALVTARAARAAAGTRKGTQDLGPRGAHFYALGGSLPRRVNCRARRRRLLDLIEATSQVCSTATGDGGSAGRGCRGPGLVWKQFTHKGEL